MPFESKRKEGPYNVEKGATYGKKFKIQKKEPWEEVFGPRHPVFDQLPNTIKRTSQTSTAPDASAVNRTELQTKRRKEFDDIKWRLKVGFKDEKAKAPFARDVLAKISADAIPLSCDNTTSTQINRVLPMASPQDLIPFMKSLSLDLQTACTHRYASNITLTLLTRVLEDYPRIVKMDEGLEDESGEAVKWNLDKKEVSTVRKELEDWTLSLGQFLLEGFEELIRDWQAGHLLRVILQVLSGFTITDKCTGNRNVRRIASWILSSASPEESVVKAVDVSDSFSNLFEEFYKKIVAMPILGDLIFYEDAVPVLVTLLLVLGQANKKWTKKLVDKMMSIFDVDPDSGIEVIDVVTTEIGTYVLQKALMLCTSKQLAKLWTGVFRGKLENMVHHPQACYLVIHLLDSCRSTDQLEEMCSELCPLMEAMMNANRHALMASLGEACRRLETCQDEYHKAIETALHIHTGDEVMLVPLLTCLQHQELFWLVHEYKGDRTGEYIQKLNNKRVKGKIQIHQQGALILQSMAGFNKPKMLFKSLVGLDQKMLKEITCHGFGHDFVQACFMSNTARLKMKQKVIAHMKGKYHVLACDLLGSRTLEAMWQYSSLRQRIVIASELVEHEASLKASLHGFSVLRKFNTTQFTKHRGKWVKVQEQDASKDAVKQEED